MIRTTTTYFLVTSPRDAWIIKKLDKMRLKFLCASKDEATNSKCLVKWNRICAPAGYGGPGIKDVQVFTRNWDTMGMA